MFSGLSLGPTPKANSRPGSLTSTVHVVQYVGPLPLRFTWPRNLAPTAGPVAPSSHSASKVSGLYRPILVTSLTNSQICSGVAAMWTVTASCTTRCLVDDGVGQLRHALGENVHDPRDRRLPGDGRLRR